MIDIKEYKISLKEQEASFFEAISKSLNMPVEEVIERTLKKSIELMKTVINYD